jgi:inosine-uridine nucleoside N-ribohydrolase
MATSSINFPKIAESARIARLEPRPGRLRMVLDTDTYNEVDDQFALVYALLAPERLSVEAVYAAPFHNDRSTGPADGMAKSYDEIVRILGKMNRSPDDFVFKGSTGYLPASLEPQRSSAALDLIERAMASPDNDPLYVLAIAAITNVASAILIEPHIIEKIVVVWLGGHALHWRNTREFNLMQDVQAARIIFDSGVPLVHIPCMGVTTHLLTTMSELNEYVRGRSDIGDYLVDIVGAYEKDHAGWSKVIWDISTVAYLNNEQWMESELVHSPIVTDQLTWSIDHARHLIRYVRYIHRDPIFKDLFRRLALFGDSQAVR